MWEKLVDWIRLLWDTGTEVKELRADVEVLQANERRTNELIRALATQNELLRRELGHEREKRADEIEKIELRLRLQISEELRRLPPGSGT